LLSAGSGTRPDVAVASPENNTTAARLDEYAALLELAEASTSSWRAYRRAAELVRSTPVPVADLGCSGRVREFRGIGPGIERRLRELVETGDIAERGAWAWQARGSWRPERR
jgi:DNA polymerase/3'-5' exonuclease PolX